ncbi:MAG: hypothetical protein HKN28_16595 [Alphaproteobacteria bacterium]|nr:hypothetical protein [Alphaproteobacteria bacterium]
MSAQLGIMAQKLKNMLEPDERVIFQTGLSLLRSIGFTTLSAIALLISFWIVDRAFGDTMNPLGALIFLVIFVPWCTLNFRIPAAILTDRRLLYQYGAFRRGIEEIPLSDIYAIEYDVTSKTTHGDITITRHKGPKMIIAGLPKRKKLTLAIAEQAGLPAPSFNIEINS